MFVVMLEQALRVCCDVRRSFDRVVCDVKEHDLIACCYTNTGLIVCWYVGT